MQTELDPKTNLPKSNNDNPFEKALYSVEQPSIGAPTSTTPINLDEWTSIIRRVGADNEESRAQGQTTWDLVKGAATQTVGEIVGGIVEGSGYLLNLFDVESMSKLMKGEEADFGNFLTEIGGSIKESAQEFSPIYQTRAAQEGWALGDGSWWASHFPSLASTLSIMIPVMGASSAVRLAGRTLGKAVKTTQTGTKILDSIADASVVQRLNNSAISKIANQGSLALTSRHIENSMEASGVYEQIYSEKIAEGMDEQRAKAIAGESAAQVYRIGYMNLWQDVIAWNTLLRGSYANRIIEAGGTVRNPKVAAAVKQLREQYGDKGIIPAAALTKAGVNKKDLLLNAFGEGFEEFNQQFQQNYGLDYADFLSGKTDRETPKGFLESYFSQDLIDNAKDPKTWDASFWGFLGGLVFGGAAKYGVFDKSVDFMTRKNQMDNVNIMQREAAKFEYIKNLGDTIIKYQAEGNLAMRDATIDKFALAMTLGQIVDGNTGISIESSIAQGRFQEMYDNFKKIADAPDSQLDTQEKRDAKEVAQVLLPKMERIKNTFEKNYKNTNYNKDYDLGIASALTEYQFLNEEFDNRISEYNSKITELRNDVPVSSPEAKTVGEYKIKIKGLEKAKEQIKEELQKHNEFVESQDKTNLTKDQLGYSLYLEKEIEEINEDITFAKNAIKQAKESSEDTQLDMFADAYAEANEQLFELEASKKAFENLKERYADKYAKLQTKEGKDDYIASIKKADKSRQEKAEKAAIANAKTEEQLEAVEEVVETPAGKLAVREKEAEIIAEEIAKQELPEDSPVEAVQEKVTSNKTKSEIQKRLKEIEKQSKLSPAAIANLYADNKIPVQFQRQASTPEVQALIDEHLELQKELKSLDATSSNTKVEKQQAETVENIDKGIIEPVVIETIEDEGEQLPTSSFKIGDKVMSNADKTRGMKGVVEGFTKDNRVTVRLENNTAPSFSPQSLIPISKSLNTQKLQVKRTQFEGEYATIDTLTIFDENGTEIISVTRKWGEGIEEAVNKELKKLGINKSLSELENIYKEPSIEIQKTTYKDIEVIEETKSVEEVEDKRAEIERTKQEKLNNLPSNNWKEKIRSAKNIEVLKPIVLEVSGKDIDATTDFDGSLRGALRTPGVWDRAKELLIKDLESIEEFFNVSEKKQIEAEYNAAISALEQPQEESIKKVNATETVQEKPVTKEKPTLKTIESKPIRSTQESNTDRTDTERFPLQFKIENEKITLEPSFAQRDNPDLKNEYVASYAVQSGDSVRLELAGDRTKYKPAKEEDAVIYIVHEKLNKVIATLPSSTDKELRKEIYTILKEGNEVKTTISSNSESQIIGSSNVNNVIIDGKYYNVPLNDLENIFNHRGKIGFPITLAFVEGNEFSDADRKLAIPDKVKEQLTEYYIKDYLDNTKDATQEDAESFASDMIFQMENDISDVKLSITRNENELVLAGLPYIVVPGPNGRFKALRLENRKLLPTHVNFIIEKLKEEQNTADAVQVVNDVVYTNSDVENHFKESPSKRTPEEHEAKRKRHFRARNIESDIIIEFYSETLDAIIITTNKKLAENEYKIIQDASYTEDNKVKSVYVAGKKDLNLEQELKNALENKFFNIEKDKLTTESYTSQVTGFAYDSYFDYLTSPKELKGNNFAKNNLAKSILSTTIKPVNGTPFHNVAVIYDSITYTNRDIVVDKVTETPINTKVIKEKAKVKPEIKVKPEQVTTLKNITTEVKDVREKIKERRKASINQAQETKKNCKG